MPETTTGRDLDDSNEFDAPEPKTKPRTDNPKRTSQFDTKGTAERLTAVGARVVKQFDTGKDAHGFYIALRNALKNRTEGPQGVTIRWVENELRESEATRRELKISEKSDNGRRNVLAETTEPVTVVFTAKEKNPNQGRKGAGSGVVVSDPAVENYNDLGYQPAEENESVTV